MVDSVRDDLAGAFRLHQSGVLGAAVRPYQAILARDRIQADAAHLLGLVPCQQGRWQEAMHRVGKAVARRPGAAAFRTDLAEAYRMPGPFDRAVGSSRPALRPWRDDPEVTIKFALALQGLGRHEGTAMQDRAALAPRPDDDPAGINLGNAQMALGPFFEGRRAYSEAPRLKPDLAHKHTGLGLTLQEGRHPLPARREQPVRLLPDDQLAQLPPGERPGAHPRAPLPDGPRAHDPIREHPRGRRPRGHGAPAGGPLRPGVGAGMPVALPDRPPGPHRQPHPRPQGGLPAIRQRPKNVPAALPGLSAAPEHDAAYHASVGETLAEC